MILPYCILHSAAFEGRQGVLPQEKLSYRLVALEWIICLPEFIPNINSGGV